MIGLYVRGAEFDATASAGADYTSASTSATIGRGNLTLDMSLYERVWVIIVNANVNVHDIDSH